MSTSRTGIEWTDRTWNPVSGCTKVSPGCKHCYAETVANRFWKDRKLTDIQCHPERLDQPLRWKKASRIFVNSMSDLFHEDVPFEFIDEVFAVMALSAHTFQILTKRPERMHSYFTCTDYVALIGRWMDSAPWVNANAEADECSLPEPDFPLPNVHLGVSVENQETADERIPILLQTPASVRFLSVEPLLKAVNLSRIEINPAGSGGTVFLDALKGNACSVGGSWESGKVDWVIVGGESGPGARPCNIEWIRRIIAQCKAASVPVFVKQLGSQPLIERERWHNDQSIKAVDKIDGPQVELTLKDRKGGDINEWPEDLRIREFPV